MAWSETCKLSFEVTVKAKLRGSEDKKSINKVINEIAKESDIPKKTLEHWWYQSESARNEKFLKTQEPNANAAKLGVDAKLEKLERPKPKSTHGLGRDGSRSRSRNRSPNR